MEVSIARWLSRDPVEFAGGDWNLYRFVGNNPTINTDPLGQKGIGLPVLPLPLPPFNPGCYAYLPCKQVRDILGDYLVVESYVAPFVLAGLCGSMCASLFPEAFGSCLKIINRRLNACWH